MSELNSQFGGGAARSAVPVTAAYSVVLDPLDVQNYTNFGFYLQNIAGGDTMTSALAETAPTKDGPWTTVHELLGAPLAANSATFYQLSQQALKYLRVSAKCGVGDSTTLNVWLCAARYGR